MGRTTNGLRWLVRVYTGNIRCMAIEIALVLLITFVAVRVAEFGPGGCRRRNSSIGTRVIIA